MAIRYYEPTDLIPVEHVPILIYGPPGVGKTTLAQMTDEPFTLDFDQGLHRSSFRRRGVQVDAWADVIQLGAQALGGAAKTLPIPMLEQFRDAKTLVIDTGGRALDTMIPGIIAANGKLGKNDMLNQQGWGELGRTFVTWMKVVRSWRKQVVMLCHQKEVENAAAERAFAPEFTGQMAAKEVYKSFDQIGRLYVSGGKGFLSFEPSEVQIAKDAGQLGTIEIPNFRTAPEPRFLADLIDHAKQEIGKTAQASAAVAKIVDEWRSKIDVVSQHIGGFNGLFKECIQTERGKPHYTQVMHLFRVNAEVMGWVLDRESKVYSEG